MTARKTLTDVAIKNLKPGLTRKEVRDPGAPGLYLVIQPSGVKSFAVRYELKGGKSVKLTLGRWAPPEERIRNAATEAKVGDMMSLARARVLAADARSKVSEGRDPAGERRDSKEERRAAEANTFEVVATEYLKRQCGMRIDAERNITFDTKKLRSGPGRHATLTRSVFPTLGHRPIGEIKKSEIVRLLDKIEAGELKDSDGEPVKGGPVAADRALALIRIVMNWQAARDDDFRSAIVRGMARTKPKKRARKRVLAEDEIRDLWTALDSADVPAIYPPFVKSLLLCATRRNESAQMNSAEIDGDLWAIPGERYKTGLDHVIPLTTQAKALIGGKPEGFSGNSWFVFSTTGGRRPFAGFSKAKKALDAEIAKIRAREERPLMPRWTLHDLRRTARSLMSSVKVPTDHAERVLGHVIGGVRETYDRYEYLEEKREALAALAAKVDLIIQPRAENVVAFPQTVTQSV